MNILILTGKFGMGHYSASEAIKQEIESNNVGCNIEIIDVLDYFIPSGSRYVYSSFNLMVTKCSNVYNFINANNEDHNIKTFNYFFVSKIKKLIEEYNPEVIIATLPMAAQYVSQFKSLYKSKIPMITAITDISSHSEWIYKNTDYYLVGDIEIKKALEKKGIKESKVIVTGIPVKQQFKINSISNKKSKKEILIMGGGLGLISIDLKNFDIFNKLNSVNVTVITGNNKKLYELLKDKYENINVVGYTNEIDKYMKKADLIISKAGGITLFEAIYSEVPMYVINPFLVQEIKNSRYIEENKIGRIIWDKNIDVIDDILNLINDEEAINKMKENMNSIKKNLNQDKIINVINNLSRGA